MLAFLRGSAKIPYIPGLFAWRRGRPQIILKTLREPGHADRSLAILTLRERQVLRRLTLGWSNKQIATSLAVSVATVKTNVATIISVGGFDNRWHAASWALRYKPLIQQPDMLIPLDMSEPLDVIDEAA